jgi:hypothetical protein
MRRQGHSRRDISGLAQQACLLLTLSKKQSLSSFGDYAKRFDTSIKCQAILSSELAKYVDASESTDRKNLLSDDRRWLAFPPTLEFH